MPRDVVISHIPKTAGTALRNAIEQSNRDRVLYYDYGVNSPVTHPKIREFRRAPEEGVHFRDDILGDHRSGIVLMGHFKVADYRSFFPYRCFVSFIRDPVQRVISEYKHFVRSYGLESPLENFVRNREFRNKQTKYLLGIPLEQYGFIGVLEKGDSEFSRLADYLGVEYSVERENSAPTEQVLELDAATLSMIEEQNSKDMDLYERVLKLRAEPPVVASPTLNRSHAMRTEEGDIRGWVQTTDGEQIARIHVVRDGETLGEVEADRHRPDLRKAGISPKGYGGFRVEAQRFGLLDNVRLFLGEREIAVT